MVPVALCKAPEVIVQPAMVPEFAVKLAVTARVVPFQVMFPLPIEKLPLAYQ